MSTLIDRIETRSTNGRIGADTTTPAERLRTTMAACRLQFSWLGTSKALTTEQKAQAAEPFDAQGQFLSAGKKLLDTKHNAFRATTAIRTKITEYWRGLTLPFPEAGVRLIKHDQVEGFDQQMADFKAELADAVRNLDRCFGELKQAAAQRLGSLFNLDDYPATLVGLFGVSWNYPNIEPPDYLIGVSPELYRQEQDRVRARFEEAVQLAEQAFLDEFAKVVAHLSERISGTNEDGTPKVFRDSAIDNLCNFSLLCPGGESMEPENIRLVLECPFCGRPVPYPGPAAAGSEPMAECERCDVEFGFLPQEVRDVPVERPRRLNETLKSLRQFKFTEGVE